MTNKFIEEQQELAKNSFHQNFYFSGVKYKKTNKVWKDGHKETLVNKELNTLITTIIQNTGKELERRLGEMQKTKKVMHDHEYIVDKNFKEIKNEAIQITKKVTGRE